MHYNQSVIGGEEGVKGKTLGQSKSFYLSLRSRD
jgi:hypothetical protein